MKRYSLALFAIVLGIGLSAFTSQKTKMAPLAGEKWFVFHGTSPGDLNDPTMYSLDGNGSSPTVCTNTTQTYRCEILAQPKNGDPDQPNLATIINQTKRSTP